MQLFPEMNLTRMGRPTLLLANPLLSLGTTTVEVWSSVNRLGLIMALQYSYLYLLYCLLNALWLFGLSFESIHSCLGVSVGQSVW